MIASLISITLLAAASVLGVRLVLRSGDWRPGLLVAAFVLTATWRVLAPETDAWPEGLVHVTGGVIALAAVIFAGRALDTGGTRGSKRQHDSHLMDEIDDIFLELDRELAVRDVNAAWSRVLGRRGDEVTGRPLREFVADGEAGEVEALLHRVMQDGAHNAHDIELSLLHRDGSPRFFSGTIRHRGQNERPLTLVLHDVSRRKAAEADLARQTASLRDRVGTARAELVVNRGVLQGLLDHSPSAIVVTDLAGRFLMVNEAAAGWLGKTPAELLGRIESELHDAETAERIRQSDAWLLADGRAQQSRNTIDRDGERIDYTVSKVLLRHEGEPVAIAGFATRLETGGEAPVDVETVTDLRTRLHAESGLRRQAEREMRQLGRHFDELAQGVGRAVCISDRDTGEIEYANDLFAEMFGETAGAIGSRVPDILESVLVEDRADLEASLRPGSESFEAVSFRIRRGESVRWIEAASSDVGGESGAPARRLFIAEDVSSGRELEEHLRRQDRIDTLGRLAGGIAHEFNNLLAPILGFAELASAELGAGETSAASASVAEIAAASLRARGLVERILEFSHRRAPEIGPVDSARLTEEVARLMRPLLPAGIELRLRHDDAVTSLLGDADLLHQVLVNLCTNAKEAIASRGEGRITVTVRPAPTGEAGELVEIEVRDDGCGIPADQIDRVFDPFFTTKGLIGGTGIGLAIVRDIIERLDGSISVESAVGTGTAFHITLPRRERDPEGATRDPLGHPRGTGESILLVDDDEAVLRTTTRGLERLGYEVTAVRSGEEALAELGAREGAFDLVCTDQTMSGMTGLDLCRRIRTHDLDTSFLLVTGHRGDANSPELAEVGITEVLLKPFRLDELGAAVHRSLDRTPPATR